MPALSVNRADKCCTDVVVPALLPREFSAFHQCNDFLRSLLVQVGF